MSFIYSQALVAASSEVNCSGTDASQQLSGNPTPKPCLWHDKTTEPFSLSRFGMTCEPLTENRGAELLTLWLAGFHAKTSASPGMVQVSPESNPACGEAWRGLLAKFDPVSSLWKTAQRSLFGDSEPSSVIWPRSGMTAGGQCWELPMSERRTSATGSGFWVPTPCASDHSDRKVSANVHVSASGLTKHIAPNGEKSQMRLSQHVKLWPTPQAQDTVARKKSELWKGDDLPSRVHASGTPGKLNPTWVEWLMGWPMRHTDLKQLETVKCLDALPLPLKCLQADLSEVA